MQKRLRDAVILTLCLFYTAYLVFNIATQPNHYQWDLKIYYHAAEAYNHGDSPYGVQHVAWLSDEPIKGSFVYSPLSLPLFQLLTRFDVTTACHIYLALKLLLLVGLLWLWRKQFLADTEFTWWPLFLILAYNATIYIDLSSGNISIIEQALLWAAIYSLGRDRLGPFCALVLLAALFKLAPILFLLLALTTRHPKRWLYVGGAGALFLLLLGGCYWHNPDLMRSFLMTANRLQESGIVNPCSLSFIQDLFTYGGKYLQDAQWINVAPPGWLPKAVYLLYVIGLLSLAAHAYLALRRAEPEARFRLVVFLFSLTYALLLPRFKDYSYIVLIPAGYFVWSQRQLACSRLFLIFALLPSVARTVLPGSNEMMGFVLEYLPFWLALAFWWLLVRWLRELPTRQALPYSEPTPLLSSPTEP